jgi:hypothetical protein
VVAAGARLELTAQVRRDLVPGVVVLPANSTPQPAGVLAQRDGSMIVTLERLAAATGADDRRPALTGEVA